jgi:hypothetical protein
MGRIITLSMAVLVIVGGTGVVLSETLNQNRGPVPNPDAPARSQLDPGLHYLGPAGSNLRGEPVFMPPGYAWGGIPNPDAPSWRQLDPGLHYVGP